MQTCIKCEKEYPATTEFWHRNKNTKNGLDYYCKKCKNEINKKYKNSAKNNIRRIEKMPEDYIEIKEVDDYSLEIGKKYNLTKATMYASIKNVTGTCIGNYKKYINIMTSNGYIESVAKADILGKSVVVKQIS